MRNRLWRIDSMRGSEFTATPIDGRDSGARRFLTEVETIAEGAVPPPDPMVTSDPAHQDLLLRAFRLSLVHGSAPLMGLQRSRAIPTPYQLVPLLLAVGQERVRLLIADDVGVGKTIEMGLVTAELIARGLVRRALFVVPANLREQTRDALAHFFHLDATIVAGHLLRGLERQLMPGQSVWRAHPLVVVSVDYAKRNQGKILDAGWDLVVIDEAHLCAMPHTSQGRHAGTDMLRHEFATRAAQLAAHLILMTATPHNGYIESFASLIELLDVEAVSYRPGAEHPVIDHQKAARHVVQRRREDLRPWYEAAAEPFPFPERDQREVIVELGKQEEALLADLREYATRLAGRSSSPINGWVALHLQKRALSSPAALRRSLENRLRALQRKLVDEGGSPAEAEVAVMDQDGGDDLTDEQRSARVDRSALGDAAEIAELERLLGLARKITPRGDSKLKELVSAVIPRAFAAQRNQRVIVFTRYKDTLDYLVREIGKAAENAARDSLNGVEIFEIYGEMNPVDRRAAFARFEAAPRAVLVATDCISEGMNLQRACAALVHYELPWNPNRLEQRNGRVDRYRQPEERVTIETLVCRDPLDITILRVLVEKAQAIRREYGFSPPFFSSSRDLLDLMRRYGHVPHEQLDLFAEALDEEEPLDSEPVDVLSLATAERIRAQSFYGHVTVSLEAVQRALTDTARTVGTAAEIEAFVRAAFAFFSCPVRPLDSDSFEVVLEASTLLEDLAPEGGVIRATFDASLGQDDPSIDVLDLAHPVVRRLVDAVREAGTGALDTTQRGRTSGYAHPGAAQMLAVLHVLARFATASTPPVLMEELVPVAFPVWEEDPAELSDEALEAVLRSDRAPSSMIGRDVEEAAARALDHSARARIVDAALERRRAGLVERGQRLVEQGGAWAGGLDGLTLASQDLLTVAIVEPA